MITQRKIGLALLVSENNENGAINAIIPLSIFTFLVAITGLFAPSLMGLAVAVYAAIVTILAGLTWFYLQITATVIVGKIVIDCLIWWYNGGNEHDYYE